MKPGDKFVSVATIGSEGERLLVESILVDAGIDFVLKNDGVQNLFGAGQIGGTNLVTGPVEVLVSGSDHARAIAILDAGSGSPTEEHDELALDTCPACGASVSELVECPECGLVLSRSGLQAHSKHEPEAPPVEDLGLVVCARLRTKSEYRETT